MREFFFETDYMEIWIEQGIICIVFKKNLILSEEIAKDMVNERLKISNGVIRPLFADISELASVDIKARKYLAGEEAARFISAGAIRVNGLISKLAGNIFLSVDKPLVPSKLFTDRDKAIEWLKKYRKPGAGEDSKKKKVKYALQENVESLG